MYLYIYLFIYLFIYLIMTSIILAKVSPFFPHLLCGCPTSDHHLGEVATKLSNFRWHLGGVPWCHGWVRIPMA